jgi:two-component system response regulator DesR
MSRDPSAPAGPTGPSPRTRVLLVDERDVVQLGFQELLADEPWVEDVLAAHGPHEALTLARSHAPEVAIVGASLPLAIAVDLCGRLSNESPRTRVLLLTSEPLTKRRARAAGAAGAVPSTWRGGEIARAARTVALGMTLFAPEAESTRRILTPRELEVLELICTGATNREIAAHLTLSTNTVKEHASALYRKVSARNRAEAVVRARELGLLR